VQTGAAVHRSCGEGPLDRTPGPYLMECIGRFPARLFVAGILERPGFYASGEPSLVPIAGKRVKLGLPPCQR
jgi:hypothetical protein